MFMILQPPMIRQKNVYNWPSLTKEDHDEANESENHGKSLNKAKLSEEECNKSELSVAVIPLMKTKKR